MQALICPASIIISVPWSQVFVAALFEQLIPPYLPYHPFHLLPCHHYHHLNLQYIFNIYPSSSWRQQTTTTALIFRIRRSIPLPCVLRLSPTLLPRISSSRSLHSLSLSLSLPVLTACVMVSELWSWTAHCSYFWHSSVPLPETWIQMSKISKVSLFKFFFQATFKATFWRRSLPLRAQSAHLGLFLCSAVESSAAESSAATSSTARKFSSYASSG